MKDDEQEEEEEEENDENGKINIFLIDRYLISICQFEYL